jgi:hypothetical protein
VKITGSKITIAETNKPNKTVKISELIHAVFI